MGHIAQALRVNTTLVALSVKRGSLCSRSLHEMAAMLTANATLQVLGLQRINMPKEGATHLRRALSRQSPSSDTTTASTSSLTTLDFSWTDGLGGGRSMSWVPWLSDMLGPHDASLRILNLSGCGLRDGAGRDLLNGLRSNNKAADTAGTNLEELDVSENLLLSAKDMQDIFTALRSHTALKVFKCGLYDHQWNEQGVEDVAQALAQTVSANRSLHTLRYQEAPFHASQCKHVLPALLGNRTLRTIDFQSSDGLRGDQVFRALLDIVRTNTMIQHLVLKRTPLDVEGKAAVVLEEVQRNKDFWNTLSAFPTSKPTSARIILRGREYAGMYACQLIDQYPSLTSSLNQVLHRSHVTTCFV